MSNLFSLCSPENPCGNHGIWMRGDRVALSFAREGAPANWTGLGTILREAEKRWSGDHIILHVLWDNQDTPEPTGAYNIVLLPQA